MKIEIKTIRQKNGQERFIAVDDRRLPSWTVFSIDQETGQLTGVFGNPPARPGGLCAVRHIKANVPEIEAIKPSSIAAWVMAVMNAADIHVLGVAPKLASRDDLMSELDAFLESGDTSKARKSDNRNIENPDIIQVTDDIRGELETLLDVDSGRPYRHFIRKLGPVSGLKGADLQGGLGKSDPRLAISDIDLEKARSALSACTSPTSRAVEWFGMTSDETVARYRQQAATQFPVLASIIAEDRTIASAVDRGDSLYDVMASTWNIGKGALRRLGKITKAVSIDPLFEDRSEIIGEDALQVNRQRHLMVSGGASQNQLFHWVGQMNPDRIPQDDASWEIFNGVLCGIALPMSAWLNIPVTQIMDASKGNWVDFHKAVAKSADMPVDGFDRRNMTLNTIDALEAIDDLSRSLVLPTLLESILSTGCQLPEVDPSFINQARNIAGQIVIGQSKNIASTMMEVSRRFASRIPALMEISAVNRSVDTEVSIGSYRPGTFPSLMDRSYQASNGLVVRSLDALQLLKLESSRLKHCVGRAYLDKALSMGCHIISVQDAAGTKSFSTAELTGYNPNQPFQLTQHRAMRNGNPSAAAHTAFNEFFAKLLAGKLKINEREIVEFRHLVKDNQLRANDVLGNEMLEEERRQHLWTAVCNQDFTDENVRKSSFEEWSGIIGGAISKGHDANILYRNKDMRDLLMAMSPVAANILTARAAEARQAKVTEDAPAP